MALAVLLLSSVWGSMPRVAQGTSAKPNFVFILADDMRKDDLKYMPKTRSLLKDKGMTFQNAFVSNALCCPSRAAIMRGQYSHNTGVWSATSGPDGGWEAYRKYEDHNLATRLDRAGYETALIGKYFNGYSGTFVPPGWEEWFAISQEIRYFNYDINDNGQLRHFGTSEADYLTDVLRGQTEEFIDASVASGASFLAYVSPLAPHEVFKSGDPAPPTPAPRHQHTYDGEKASRPSSFNEKDVSDKPPWIQQLPRLSDADKIEIDAHHEGRAETLQALTI